MTTNYKKIKEELNNLGFSKIEIGNKKFLTNLRKKWLKMFHNISIEKSGLAIKSDKDLIKLEKSKYRKSFVAVFDLIHLDPEIYKLASQKKLISIYKKLGIKYPHYGTRPITRVDMPNDLKYSFFDAHQDYPYNKHSKNSLVIWIPFANTGHKEGCLEVSPKSHLTKKIFPQKKNKKLIKNSSLFNFKKVKVNLGEALIFSEFLVHRSGINRSKKIRFSLQLRVTDLLSKEYMNRYYPVIR